MTAPSPLLTASAGRLAAALAERGWLDTFDAGDAAAELIASGVVVPVASLADDEALVEAIAGRPSGRLVVQHILRALAAALEDR